MSSILGFPPEVGLHCLSFLNEQDKFSSHAVSREWRAPGEQAIRDQYRAEIASMKESLIETLEMEVTEPSPLYSDFSQLVEDLPLLQIPPLKDMTLPQLSEQMHALRELFPHAIVRVEGSIFQNKRTREITERDMFHLRDEVAQIYAASNLEFPSRLSVNPGDFFVLFKGKLQRGHFQGNLNPSLFTHFAPFSLCRELPEYFPEAFFPSVEENVTTAFLLKGRIVILNACTKKDLKEEIASPNALPLRYCYVSEKDKWDFYDSNLQRRRNLNNALLKSILLTERIERTFFFPEVRSFLRGDQRGNPEEMLRFSALKAAHPGFFAKGARYINNDSLSENKSQIRRYLSDCGDEEIILIEKLEKEMEKLESIRPLIIRSLTNTLQQQIEEGMEFYEIMARVYFFSKTYMDECNAKLKESLNRELSLLETRIFQHKMRDFEDAFNCEFMKFLHNFFKDTQFGPHRAFCHYFTLFKIGDLVFHAVDNKELAEIYRGVEFGDFCDSFHQREVELKALTLFDCKREEADRVEGGSFRS